MFFDEKQNDRVFWIIVLTLLLLTRIGAAAQYLSVDNVNLAFSLEYFDPLNHQPQPPGYPFFVLFARIVNFAVRHVEYTFLFLSMLATGVCLGLTAALGRRMFSAWTGKAAALLLLVNAVFWHTGADSPLRPFLAMFSLLTAYCSWRCWNGEPRYALWGALALGVGSGFRPELLPYLLPLWFVSMWLGTRSFKDAALGLSIIAAMVLIWVGALAVAVGGPQALARLIGDYLVEQSRGESPLMGADLRGWLRQMSRLVVWNGLAVVWWIWALPIFMRSKPRLSLGRRAILFMVTWLAPGLFQSAAIHVAAPGHTLFSVPALCLLGAHVLSIAAREFSNSETSFVSTREILLAASLVFSVMVFLNFFPVPDPSLISNTGGPSLINAIAFATHETSFAMVRSMDRVAFQTLKELHELTPLDRPSLILTTDVHTAQWILNWRIMRYYVPTRDIWVLGDHVQPKLALHVRRYESIESESGAPTIPVPKGGRILWVLDRTSPFYKEMAADGPVTGGQYVFYTDISTEAAAFSLRGFKFVPE